MSEEQGKQKNMNIREIYKAARRAYRVAHAAPILAKGGIENRIATTQALRAVTGKWDTCEQYTKRFIPQYSKRRTKQGNTTGSPVVYLACTRFLKSH